MEKQFEKLIKENELLLHKVCSMYAYDEASKQDLFQEIIIQLWKAFPSFRGESKLSTWLYRVALNTAITGLRKEKRRQPGKVQFTRHIQLSDPAPDAEEEQSQQLYEAIEQLNDIEKAIVMFYLEDKSYEEMEEVLGMSQGNLRVKMTRIKEKLRQLTKYK
ncbi:RNA polymerase sigma factor [Pontibacter chitinilyticus]|uniref:RNA polymerase sigma factor n=1 Tax=Pontibacter chitinilyticus TaxID=2674989 RepID=UPI0032191D06